MPRINLLPWRESERKRKRQEFILSIGAAIATAALVTLLGRWQMSAAIEHQNERNRILGEEIAELDRRSANAADTARVPHGRVVRWLRTWGTPGFRPWPGQ